MNDAEIDIILRAVNQASAELNKVKSDLQGVSKDVDKTADTTRKAGDAGGVFGSKMQAGTLLAAAGFAGAGVAATGFIKGAVSDFASFDTSMREVFTLLPGISGQAMDQMKSQTIDAANEMNRMPEEVVPALYQALSAGVPQGNVFEFLETANQAAKGGVTDLTTAVDALSSVTNAYGPEVISATEASDLMFTAVRLGKTTFEEMSATMANVTPIAAASGVAFEEITASIATITSQGTPTSQAVTQIRSALVELNDSGSDVAKIFQEIAGVSFGEFIANGGTMTEALQMIRQHADDTGVEVQNMFGRVEGGLAVLQLTGANAETASENLDAMANSAGATEEAFNTMTENSPAEAMADMAVQVQTLKLAIGEGLAPVIVTLVGAINTQLIPALSDAKAGFFDLKGIIDPLASETIPAFNAANEESGGILGEVAGQAGNAALEYGKFLVLGPAVYGLGAAHRFLGEESEKTSGQIAQMAADGRDMNQVYEESRRLFSGGSQELDGYAESATNAAEQTGQLSAAEEEATERIQATTDAQNAHLIMFGQVGEAALQQADALRVVADASDEVVDANGAIQISLDNLAGAYSAASDIQSTFSQQGSDYAGTASSMEKALEVLQKRQEEGIQLTDEQSRFLETATGNIEAMQNASEDAAVQEGMAAAVKAELKAAQDAVNEAHRTGSGDLEVLEARLADAEQAAADLGVETYNEQGVMQDLNTTMGDLAIVVDGLKQIMIELGLVKAEPEVDLQGEDLAIAGIQDVQRELGLLPDSFTIDAFMNTAPFMESLASLRANTPSSPAEEGPFSTLPNWDFLFDQLPEASENAVNRFGSIMDDGLTEVFSRISPMFEHALEGMGDDSHYAMLQNRMAELWDWVRIAKDLNMGDQVVQGLLQEIDAVNSEMEAIGEIIGSAIGLGIVGAIDPEVLENLKDSFDRAADEISEDFKDKAIGGLPDFDDIASGEARQKAVEDLERLLAQREAYLAAGLDVSEIDEKIQILTAQIEAIMSIEASDAAQAWKAGLNEGLDAEGNPIVEWTEAQTEQLIHLAKTNAEQSQKIAKDVVAAFVDARIPYESAMRILAAVPRNELMPALVELADKLRNDLASAILDGDEAARQAAMNGLALLEDQIAMLGIAGVKTIEDLRALLEAMKDVDEQAGKSTINAGRSGGSGVDPASRRYIRDENGSIIYMPPPLDSGGSPTVSGSNSGTTTVVNNIEPPVVNVQIGEQAINDYVVTVSGQEYDKSVS